MSLWTKQRCESADEVSKVVQGLNGLPWSWLIAECFDRVEVIPLAGTDLPLVLGKLPLGNTYRGRLFCTEAELSWVREGDAFVLHLVSDQDKGQALTKQVRDLSSAEDRFVYLWGEPLPRPNQSGDRSGWYQQRTGWVNLPLQWSKKQDRPQAKLRLYRGDLGELVCWRFADLRVSQ